MPLPAPLARATFPPAILEILRTLGAAGHRSWLVGGAVRDLLLGRAHDARDFDVATPATPAQVQQLFRKVIPTGLDHGTVMVLLGGEEVEVTTFRGEGDYLDGRRPASVTFHTDLDADLLRRDFTVNALAFDPLVRELADPFGGQADLEARLLRAVGDPVARFAEDGLRPLRGARFVAQLGFALEPATQAAIAGALPVVAKVSAERVGEELAKLSAGPHVAAALELLGETGLLGLVLPPLGALPAGVRRHLGETAQALPVDPAQPAGRLAALLHALPPAEVAPLLARIRLPRAVGEAAAALVAGHACLREADAPELTSPAAVRRWLAAIGPQRAGAVLALRAAEVAALPEARRPSAEAGLAALRAAVAAVRAAGDPLTAGQLALDGQGLMAALGCGPGPHVGEGLRALLAEVLEDPSLNDAARLVELARAWWRARPA